MPHYSLLFDVTLTHAYSRDGSVCGFEFSPTRDCRRRMENTGVILRQTKTRLNLFYDKTRTESLVLHLSDASPSFDFKVDAASPKFRLFTELPPPDEAGGILFFSSGTSVLQDTGRYRLSRHARISPADMIPIETMPVRGMLNRHARPPLCIIAIVPELDGTHPVPRSYDLSFTARQTVWRYCLTGSQPGEDLSVVDADGQIRFEQKADESIAGDRTALVFESDRPIPLTHRPPHRFQLRKTVNGVNRILVKRLPVASADQFSTGINDTTNYFSDIFFNL